MAEQVLPDEVTAALATHEETTAARLAALENALVAKRTEAVNARKESGIESIWLAAEEAYLGIDDSNRGAFAGAKWAKPTSLTGTVTTNKTPASSAENNSNAFVRITSRYVDAGAAKLSEILLPADEKAFSFTATPVPELVHALKDTSQAVHNGVPLERDARPEEMQPLPGAASLPTAATPPAPAAGTPPAAPGSSPGVPLTVRDLAQEKQEQALAAAKKAEKRIHDWMIESRFRAEGRKVVFDAARIGVGVLKAPFPRNYTSRSRGTSGGVKINKKVSPAYAWTDPWNCYPDPACGENIQNGDHFFEAEPFSRKQLRKLQGLPGYIDAAIDRVLAQGPAGVADDNQRANGKATRHHFVAWHFYGALKREDMLAAGTVTDGDLAAKDEVYAICTMVNDTLIRATINPLDSGEIPYHAVPWQRRPGYWAGVGVGEQIEMPQRAINAATRACFNNAGKSAGSITVVDRGSIEPANKDWTLTPDKLFYKTSDATSDDVRKAFAFFQIPNVTASLMSIIELCLKFAEEVTNIPLVTQGQSGTTTPETYGATQLQNNNANQLLRSIGYAFDDYITEPVVNQSYEYLLLDPDVPEDEKGDWTIDAHGSVALVERAIQNETVTQMGQFAINPAFGVDPKRWFAEFSKTKHLNPKNFQYTPEEQAKIDAMPKPAAPAIEVAKIKSGDAKLDREVQQALAAQASQVTKAIADGANQTKAQIAEMRKEVDELRVKKDTDRDTAYVQAERERVQVEATARREELAVKRELALLEYANVNKTTLDKVKAELSQTAMTLQTQERMQAREHGHEMQQVAVAAAEPTGKAAPGKGFTE